MPGPALSDLIDHGRAVAPADPALRGGRVFELITGDLAERGVEICGDAIAGVSGIMRCCR